MPSRFLVTRRAGSLRIRELVLVRVSVTRGTRGVDNGGVHHTHPVCAQDDVEVLILSTWFDVAGRAVGFGVGTAKRITGGLMIKGLS